MNHYYKTTIIVLCNSPGPALLEVEEAEAVDDPDDGVVQTLLPPRRAKVRVLQKGNSK